MRVEASLMLNSDNTVDGTITLAPSEQLIEQTGVDPDDALSQIQGPIYKPPPEGVEVEESGYEEDGFVGKTYTYSGATLEQISRDGNLTVTRKGDTFVVMARSTSQRARPTSRRPCSRCSNSSTCRSRSPFPAR